MENKKEKTAPDVSVGADTEQPISKNTISSISENGGNIKSFEELQREMQLQSDPSYLQTISMNELFDTQYRSNPYWEGSPTALVALINMDIQPHVITRKLNVLAGRLYTEHGILFRSERVHEGRKLRFWKDNTENA